MTNQVKFEIQTSPGVWTDISNDIYQRDGLTISRGRTDEQSQSQPQVARFTIENRDGKYSARNPMSPLYGLFGRNTPVRITENSTYQRFYGEIPRVAPVWEEDHSDNWIQVEAAGILRRLTQGQSPAKTALRDYVLGFGPQLSAYYPLSAGSGATYDQNIAPGATGQFGGRNSPLYTFGTDMGATWLGTGMELNATGASAWMQGAGVTAGAFIALDFVFQSSAIGVLDLQLWPDWDSWFQLRLNNSGNTGTAQVSYYDGNNTLVTSPATGVLPALQDGQLHTCRFILRDGGGTVPIQYRAFIDGNIIDFGTNGINQKLSGVPLFRFFYTRYTGQTVVDLAHLALWSDNTEANLPTETAYTSAAFAYGGETAIDRVVRVAADGGIPVSTVGLTSESTVMGPQFSESRVDAIRDVENTDLGILYESRTTSGLVYASRASLYNKTPAFTLNYAAGHVVAPLEPADDDQNTRNDVTATRRDGGSAEVTVDTGPMSTQDPPTGVGRYQSEVTVNVQTDGMLTGVASWVANIGTLNQARWPSVTVNLNAPTVNAALANQIRAAEIGDWFVITGMQQAFVYDDVTLVIIGYTESIDPFVHTITFNCMPAEPYTVAVYGTSRYDADGSTLTSGVTATATSISATKSGATLWTTDPTMFPFDIRVGGERMTVTNITGTSSPQTLTVTRSKNGVVKAQTAGTLIELWDTPRYAL